MKRIIEGITYNTDTATPAVRYSFDDDENREVEVTVYQNRGGALFKVHKTDTGEVYKYDFYPISRERLVQMIEKGGQIEIIDENIIEAPPEAEAEQEQGATIYLRVPSALKARVDEAAKGAKVSANVWAMRCIERCLEDKKSVYETRGFRT